VKVGDHVRLSAAGRAHFAYTLSRRGRPSKLLQGGVVTRLGTGKHGPFVDVSFDGKTPRRFHPALWERGR
jgi:hypothetical protein